MFPSWKQVVLTIFIHFKRSQNSSSQWYDAGFSNELLDLLKRVQAGY